MAAGVGALWATAEEIVAERTSLSWARRVLKLCGAMPRTGEKLVVRGDRWVFAQSIETKHPENWSKILIGHETHVDVVKIQNDGWVIVLDSERRSRYKIWPTDLKA